MVKLTFTPRPLVILVSLVFTSFALIAQNPSTVDRMIRQRDSLENEIKLEQLRSSLKELNSVSESFVAGKSNDIEKIIAVIDRLCADRYKYKSTNSANTPGPSNELSNRLNGFGKPGGTSSGQGSTNGVGDQGSPNGTGGSGGGNYQLGTRSAIERPIPRYNCDGEGIVVVKIYVDRNGVVKRADGQGEKGSTTANECLIRRAEEAALKTKWNPDPNSPELQVGTIRYNFQRT
jgi:hypothetical protein